MFTKMDWPWGGPLLLLLMTSGFLRQQRHGVASMHENPAAFWFSMALSWEGLPGPIISRIASPQPSDVIRRAFGRDQSCGHSLRQVVSEESIILKCGPWASSQHSGGWESCKFSSLQQELGSSPSILLEQILQGILIGLGNLRNNIEKDPK